MSRKELFHGTRSHGCGVFAVSTGTSVPRPRASAPDLSDSALLDTLLREAPIGFAFFGSDLRFRRVNQALAGLAGLDPAGHVGRTPSEVWPADLAAAAADALGRVLAAGMALESAPPEPGELPAEPVGPGAHWSFSWYPSHDSDGLVAGVALIAVDHSQRHASAEDLRRSQERYRSLIQAGAQVVWVTAPDGRIAEDSPAWRWITGQSIDEFAASGWLDAVHPDDRERVEQEWAGCLGSGQAFDSRYRIRSRSGSYRHYDVRAVAVERDGKIIEWVGASTDVTGQREAEEMRGRLTEQLSAAALRTARLQQATSMLAEALTVEQVVEVITEVGRTAIGALHSAVALLESDGARLRVVNPDGMPTSPDSAGLPLTLQSPSVLTKAIATRRPVLVEDPEDLRRQLEGELEIDPAVVAQSSDERSWVGLPLFAAGAPLGALRFSFGRPRKITEEERVFLEALAGQCGDRKSVV